MLSGWREARLIFCQSQSSYGMARFENVLYSVNDGAAREWLDMEREARVDIPPKSERRWSC